MIHARDYRDGNPIEVANQNGVIATMRRIDAGADDLLWIAPGLVDLQVNGFGGQSFGDPARARQAAHEIVRTLWRHGVTTMLPTVVTNAEDAIEESMRGIAAAVAEDAVTARGIGGIHLEGPFISPEDGARGAHPARFVRPPDWELFCRWQSAAGGLIRLVTLSPEWPDAVEFIRRCAGSGAKVAIGHTSADSAQIAAAADAGASLTTHFGNGAHAVLPRHPNYLWDQLAEDRLWSSLIADGFHLPRSVVKSVMKVKGGRAFLVSDVVALSGLPPGEYGAPGRRVHLSEDGRLSMVTSPNLLAGSVKTLDEAVEQVIEWRLADLRQTWHLASSRPARYMGWRHLGVRAGAHADLVLFSLTGDAARGEPARLDIRRVYVAGNVVYDA